jgi:hypothetical protein
MAGDPHYQGHPTTGRSLKMRKIPSEDAARIIGQLHQTGTVQTQEIN